MTEQDKVISNDGVSRRSFLGKNLGRSGSGSKPSDSGCGGFGVSAGYQCGWTASVLVVKQTIRIVGLSIYLFGAAL
jgi:hypothetical protein